MPSFFAFEGRITFPDRPYSSAVCRLVSAASRCRPFMPGRTPSCTSGNPSTVLRSSERTRPWHASAISKPPPSAAPWIAATIGFGDAAIFATASCPLRQRASAPAAVVTAFNISMSAPAIQVSGLPLTRTAALIFGFSATSVRARSRSAAMVARIVFTASPGTSYVSSATPSSRTAIEITGPSPLPFRALMLPPGPPRRRGRRPRRS